MWYPNKIKYSKCVHLAKYKNRDLARISKCGIQIKLNIPNVCILQSILDIFHKKGNDTQKSPG